jgi:hypothetical protein
VLDFYFITFALIPTFMTSRDPYAAEQYGRPTQYADVPGYNPYGGNDHQPHQTYDQEGYEPYETAAYRDEQQMQPHEHPTFPPVTHNKETNEFLNGPGEKCAAFCSHCVETCADAKYQVQTCLEELPVSKPGRSMDEGEYVYSSGSFVA